MCERDLAKVIKKFNLSNAKVRNVFKQNLNYLESHSKIKKLRAKRNRISYEEQMRELSSEAKSGKNSAKKKTTFVKVDPVIDNVHDRLRNVLMSTHHVK